jgi:hypothetical protein
MLKLMISTFGGTETSRSRHDQLRHLRFRLVGKLLAWETRSAIEAERRCERIGATIGHSARKCLGRR